MRFRVLLSILPCLELFNLSVAQDQTSAILELQGIAQTGDVKFANIKAASTPSIWCTEGEVIDGYKLVSINLVNNTVTLADTSNHQHQITLSRNSILADGPVPIHSKLLGLSELNWKWIKSAENSMRHEPETLPAWAYRHWAAIGDEAKINLHNYYRSHGWDFEVNVRSPTRIFVHNVRLKDPSEPPSSAAELQQKRKGAVQILPPEPNEK